MANDLEVALNQAAYERMKDEIASHYPYKQFVAIGRGKIIADAKTFDELIEKLAAIGWDCRDVLVEQAGVIVPRYGVII